jgi:hypothetical protein
MDEQASRQKPKRSDAISVAGITLLVRPPGRPQLIRAFTDAERADAELYAEQAGATVETLPLP